MGGPDIRSMARSFQPRQWFPHGFDDGRWFTESAYNDKEKAANRVNWLNGGGQ